MDIECVVSIRQKAESASASERANQYLALLSVAIFTQKVRHKTDKSDSFYQLRMVGCIGSNRARSNSDVWQDVCGRMVVVVKGARYGIVCVRHGTYEHPKLLIRFPGLKFWLLENYCLIDVSSTQRCRAVL